MRRWPRRWPASDPSLSRCACALVFVALPAASKKQPINEGVDDIKRAWVGKSGVRYPPNSGTGDRREWRLWRQWRQQRWMRPPNPNMGRSSLCPVPCRQPSRHRSPQNTARCVVSGQVDSGMALAELDLKLLLPPTDKPMTMTMDGSDGQPLKPTISGVPPPSLALCCAPAGPLPSTPSETV